MGYNLVCPSCAAPLDESSRFEDSIICPYCGNQSAAQAATKALSADAPGSAGDSATLAMVYSRFEVGMSGSLRWQGDVRQFNVVGCVQFQYDGGFWYEWYLDFDGQGYWLQEDEGVYILFIELVADAAAVTQLWQTFQKDAKAFGPGRFMPAVNENMRSWQLLEKGMATISASEGGLPVKPKKGEKCWYFDGVGDGVYYSLELDEKTGQGTVFQGWPLEYEQLRLEGEPDFRKTTGEF